MLDGRIVEETGAVDERDADSVALLLCDAAAVADGERVSTAVSDGDGDLLIDSFDTDGDADLLADPVALADGETLGERVAAGVGRHGTPLHGCSVANAGAPIMGAMMAPLGELSRR